MRHVLAILSLALVGCVTVQPCVCPPPAPKVECDPILNPEACAVYDAAPPNIILTPAQPVWFDGLNWHTAASPENIDRWPFGANADTSLSQTTITPKPLPDQTPTPMSSAKDGDCLWYDENGETEHGKGTAWKPCPTGVIWVSCGASTGRLLPGDTLDERGRPIPIMETRTVPCFGTPPAKSQRKAKP